MKTIYITIIILFLSISINAQQQINAKTSLEIPQKLKSKEKFSVEKLDTYTFEIKYYKDFGGFVVFTFDKNGKIILINAPKTTPKNFLINKSKDIGDDFENCRSNCGGGFWCTWNCARAILM